MPNLILERRFASFPDKLKNLPIRKECLLEILVVIELKRHEAVKTGCVERITPNILIIPAIAPSIRRSNAAKVGMTFYFLVRKRNVTVRDRGVQDNQSGRIAGVDFIK
ncbi:hypothetical protein IKE72_02615, partial [Candidatus Saccharibacteria bacterium]|nr:hypothetical protein [Candidatus Saccharibacteria bacterium]